jgi:NCS1 family nucleobase:cation symporter-1
MLVSVSPTFPGIIRSINSRVHIGAWARLFDIAYLLGVSFILYWAPYCYTRKRITQFVLASTVYFGLSKMFPAHETFIERTIVDPETPPSDKGKEKADGRVEEAKVG